MKENINGREMAFLMNESVIKQIDRDGGDYVLLLEFSHTSIILRTTYDPAIGFNWHDETGARATIIWASQAVIDHLRKFSHKYAAS
jgi:hypothetical protein